MSTKQWNFSCQRRRAGAGDLRGQAADWDKMPAGAEAGTGTRCRRGPRLGPGQDAGDQITWAGSGLGAARDWDKMPAGKSPGWATCLERSGTGRDAGEKNHRGRRRAWSGQGPDKMPAEPRLSRQRENQLKRKRSIISSSNPGFSKSFSLVMIKLLCSKNPASW